MTAHQLTWVLGGWGWSVTAHQVTGGWGVVECDSTSSHLGGGGHIKWSVTAHQVTWWWGVECDSTSSHLGGGGGV